MKRIIWLSTILMLLAGTLYGQFPAVHRLYVRDLAGLPIPDVAVSVGNEIVARTDQDGFVAVVNPCQVPGGGTPNLVYFLSKPGFNFGYSGGQINCYGGFQFTYTIYATSLPKIAPVSAANFKLPLASQMMASLFGTNLADTTLAATTLPLPTTLAGRRVKVSGATGRSAFAELLFVSPTQINFVFPAEITEFDRGFIGPTGWVTVVTETSELGAEFIILNRIAPSLFTASGNGHSVAAAVALRVKADGSQAYEPVARFDNATRRFEPIPIDLGSASERVFLILFGTGFRNRTSFDTTVASIGGTAAEIVFSGAQPGSPGLDQVNLLLPRSLAGRGEVQIMLNYGAYVTNAVTVNIK